MTRKFYIEDNETPPAIRFELTAPSGFTEITDEEQLKKLFENEYSKRASAGQTYYNEIRTRIYRDYVNNLITANEAFNFEVHIKGLGENLFTGNWLTAQNTNQNLNLSGIYTQAIKDEFQGFIDEYISNNY